MNVEKLLEERSGSLVSALDASADAAGAAKAVEDCWDSILYAYNEKNDDAGRLHAASAMIRAVKSQSPLIGAMREPEVYVKDVPARAGGGRRAGVKKPLMMILPAAAGALLLFALFFSGLSGRENMVSPGQVLSMAAFTAGGALLLFMAGRASSGGGADGKKEYITRARADSGKIMRLMRSAAIIIDQEIEDMASSAKEGVSALSGDAFTGERELDLWSGLLEASYSGNREYAFAKIDELRSLLAAADIDVVDYSPDKASWFDVMPSSESGTLRPALAKEGKLLRKGMVSASGRDY